MNLFFPKNILLPAMSQYCFCIYTQNTPINMKYPGSKTFLRQLLSFPYAAPRQWNSIIIIFILNFWYVKEHTHKYEIPRGVKSFSVSYFLSRTQRQDDGIA
jgi:hypothetical protein